MATLASSNGLRPWLRIDGAVVEWDDGTSAHETPVLEEWQAGGYRSCVIEPMVDAPLHLDVLVDDHRLAYRQDKWLWQPEGSAGLYRLDAYDLDTGVQRRGWLRVLPTTVNYQHYQVMLDEIQAISYHLIFQSTGSAREAVRLSDGRGEASVGLVEYHKLALLMPHFERVLNSLRRSPREILVMHARRVPAGTAAQCQIDPPFEDVEEVSPDKRVPRDVTAQFASATLDVYENQLVRHCVRGILSNRIQQVKSQLEHEIAQRDASRLAAEQNAARAKPDKADGWYSTAAREATHAQELRRLHETVETWQRVVRRWAQLPFIQAAGPLRQKPQPSPTLLYERHYRQFYKLFLDLRRDLRLIDLSGLTSLLHTRQQWQLYEMWAVLTLTHQFRQQLLDGGYRQTSVDGLYRVTNNGFEIDIDRSQVLEFARGQTRVRIAYERLYESYKTVRPAEGVVVSKTNSQLTPDLAIEVYRPSMPPQLMLLDAKYKHDNGHARQEDINKVHTSYVVLLGLANPAGGKPLNVESRAIVVFPGSIANLPVGADCGALPLVPGGPPDHLEAYASFFRDWLATCGA